MRFSNLPASCAARPGGNHGSSLPVLLWAGRAQEEHHGLRAVGRGEGENAEGDVLQRLKRGQGSARRPTGTVISGSQAEHSIDEPVLHPNVTVPHPPNLTLANLVHGFVTLNRPPCTAELTKMLLGTNPSLDGTVILLENVIEILNRPMTALFS